MVFDIFISMGEKYTDFCISKVNILLNKKDKRQAQKNTYRLSFYSISYDHSISERKFF
jgi:hypothetical protein